MQNGEIVKLTRKRVGDILKSRRNAQPLASRNTAEDRRQHPRWPFKGAVELWPDGTDGRTLHATCMNISESGIGLRCDEQLQMGDSMEVAVHIPEMTLCGQAIVRYCAEANDEYIVGMEFQY